MLETVIHSKDHHLWWELCLQLRTKAQTADFSVEEPLASKTEERSSGEKHNKEHVGSFLSQEECDSGAEND